MLFFTIECRLTPAYPKAGDLDLPCPWQEQKSSEKDHDPWTSEGYRDLLENQNNRCLSTGLNKPILGPVSPDIYISASQWKEGFIQKKVVSSIKGEAASANISGYPTQSDAQRALNIVMSYYRDHPDEITLQEYLVINRIMGHLKP